MCGITGVFRIGTEPNANVSVNEMNRIMLFLNTHLLELTQPRGPEATGIAVMSDNCNWALQKMGVDARTFISRFSSEDPGDINYYSGLVRKCVDSEAPIRIILGHCRKPSAKGGAPPTDNKNNHPILAGNTIGIHNGTISNKDLIIKNAELKVDGDVDSEAIVRLLDKGCPDSIFNPKMINDVGHRLQGTCALLAFNVNNPFQVAGIKDGRPMEAALIRPLNLLLVASEDKFIKETIMLYAKESNLFRPEWPTLSTKDVAMGAPPTLSTFLLDLSGDVKSDSVPKDFWEAEDLKYASRKWHVEEKSYVYNSYNYEKKVTTPDTTKGTTGTDSTGASGSEGTSTCASKRTHRVGVLVDESLLWDDESRTYKRASALEPEDTVVIDLSSKEINITNTKTPTALICSSAKIKNISYIDDGRTNKVSENTKVEDNSMEEKKVLLSISKQAIESSEQWLEDFGLLETNEDLSDLIKIKSVENLKNMELYSIANRLIRTVAKQAFALGFDAGIHSVENPVSEDEVKASELLKKMTEKKEAASENIRTLKAVIQVLGKVSNPLPATMKNHIETIFSEKKIQKSKVRDAITDGDVRGIPTLEKLKDIINTEQ